MTENKYMVLLIGAIVGFSISYYVDDIEAFVYDLPPTKAFSKIIFGNTEVEAQHYRDSFTFGKDFNYTNGEIAVSWDEAQLLALHNSTKLAVTVTQGTTDFVWAIPLSEAELLNTDDYRMFHNIEGYNQARILVGVNTVGIIDSTFEVEYSEDEINWYALGSSPIKVKVDQNGLIKSNWFNIVEDAKGDVFLRVIGYDGNGIAVVTWRTMEVQFK